MAIVGTRKSTSCGREVSYKLAYDLAKHGVVVVSGLALGVDIVAHRAILNAGGTTLAVLANGLDTIYPASHKDLTNSIIANGGAIISEPYDKINIKSVSTSNSKTKIRSSSSRKTD